jgi:hypothetical protein
VEIKDVYLSVYKKKLADDIRENYNGVLQRILLGLLDGTYNLPFNNQRYNILLFNTCKGSKASVNGQIKQG